MYLTQFEKKMLAGEFGVGDQEAMKLLVAIGDALGAERMVEISRAHVSFTHFPSDKWYTSKMLADGARCRISPTNNPLYDVDYLEKSGFGDPVGHKEHLRSVKDTFQKLGITLTYSCTPEIQQNVPRFGEHVAFAESSATPYVNAVCGARSNRESAKSAFAAAVTGRTPLYGFHLDENRYGDTLINVETAITDDFDYHLLGYVASQKMGFGVPVFTGMPKNPTQEELVSFGAQLATGGSVGMYHIVGVTPEAPDIETAFHGNTPHRTITITSKDLNDVQKKLSKGGDKIDFVMFGCPHYSITQIVEIARDLNGRQIHGDIDFWILASAATRRLAGDMGLLDIIEKAGGHIMENTCADDSCWWKIYGGKVGVTDSVKAAYYTPRMGVDFHLRRRSECVEIAIKGGFVNENQ
ncbi:MAG: aconitase X catalytic domain-containing protein [Deltaproteobacteria bacterium]|nr:aconitase X catalytic domain-containing protein [Deltaproteobacteria bacterium]